MTRTNIIVTLLSLFFSIVARGQMMEPVHFASELKMLGGDEAEIVFSGKIDDGWHVYSTDLGSGGPTSASFQTVKMTGAEKVGGLKARGKEIRQFDKLFEMEVRYFEKQATFVQRIRFTKPQYDIDCVLQIWTFSIASTSAQTSIVVAGLSG